MTFVNLRLVLGLQTLLFVGLGIGLWLLSGRELSTFLSVTPGEVGLGGAIGAGLIAVVWLLFRCAPVWSEKLVRLQARNFALLGQELSPATMGFIAVCAGVGEEALFRAGLQTLAADHLPLGLAIVLPSILFTLVHCSKPLVSVIQFSISCLLGLVYFYSGSLLAVMIAHAVYDVFALWFLQRELRRLELIGETKDNPEPVEVDD